MNFVPSTSHPGKLFARFWPYDTTTTSNSCGLYGDTTTTVLAVSSEGQKIRTGAFNGAGPTVSFSTTNIQKYYDLYTYSGSPVITKIVGVGLSGLGPVNGVLDFTIFSALSGQCNMFSSYLVNKVNANSASLSLYIPSLGRQVALDLSQCLCAGLIMNASYCSSLSLPASNTYLTYLNLSEHRIYGGDLIFPSLPNLTQIDFSTGQVNVGTFNNVDVSLLPAITNLNFGSAGFKILTIGSNTFSALTTIQFYGGRVTARNIIAGNGPFVNVLSLITQAKLLTTINLSYNGLSEAEQGQILDALISTAASRPSSTKTLSLDGLTLGSQYPYLFNNGIGATPQHADNAQLPTVALRAKVTNLVTNYAWTINYNKTIVVTVTPLSSTRLRLTYEGDSVVDVWTIGSTINFKSSNSSKVLTGVYTVITGSGKIWDVAATNTVTDATYTLVDVASYSPSVFARSAGATSYKFPAIPGALSIAFWMRSLASFSSNAQTLFDNRTLGSPVAYLSNQAAATGFTTAAAAGSSILSDSLSLRQLDTLGWVRMYLETDLADQFLLGNRSTGTEFLASHDLADVRVYNRLWTSTEQADGLSTLPDLGVIAKYNFLGASGTNVPDTATGSYPALIQGSFPTLYPNTNPADYFVQTAGPGASTMTILNGTVTSIQASATTNFITKSTVGTPPLLLSTPSLNNANVLSFPGGQVLELDSVLPTTYLGNSPRSFYFLMNIPQNESRNIFGYGTQTHSGIYDMLMYGTNIGLHWYGGGVYAQVAVPFGQWCLFRTHYDGAGNVTHQIDNNPAVTQATGTLNTGTTQTFRLGEGTYPNYNGSGAGVSLAHFEAFSTFQTPAQDLVHSNRIRSIYGMTTY